SPDGHTLASGGVDNTLKFWDVPSSSPLREYAAAEVNGVALSPDGTKLAAACQDGLVRVWGALDRKELFKLAGHAGPVHQVAFSANGQSLASAGSDRTVRFWNAANGQPVAAVGAHTAAVTALVLHPNNTQAFSAGEDGLVKFWQLPPPAPRAF